MTAAWQVVEAIETTMPEYMGTDKAQKVLQDNSLNPIELHNGDYTRDAAFYNIGGELASKGDLAHALSLVDRMTGVQYRIMLLGAIAKAQHDAKDQQAAEATMSRMMEILNSPTYNPASRFRVPPEFLSSTFAYCEDFDKMQAVIPATPELIRNMLKSQAVRTLLDEEKIDEAEKLVNSPDIWVTIKVGATQDKKGEHAAAKATLTKAQALLLKQQNASLLPLLLQTQIDIGDY